MKILITGGNGFIGSTLIKILLKNKNTDILNIDKVSKYSVSESLSGYNNKNYTIKKIDLLDYKRIKKLIFDFKPSIIFHLAAESHVDRSITGPKKFVENNFISTLNMLESFRSYYNKSINEKIKFINVSTDEVYGSLTYKQKAFTEKSSFLPNSPYSASKASADHLARAWHETYNLPIITTHCSNNYGPWQFPEKLIPIIVYNLFHKTNIPVYGNGKNIRDWIYVEDHAKSLIAISKKGIFGETYNIGGDNEISNINLIKMIIKIFQKHINDKFNYLSLIKYVDDRLGHDVRYAINNDKLNKLNINFKNNFEKNLKHTVIWYIKNINWVNKKIKQI